MKKFSRRFFSASGRSIPQDSHISSDSSAPGIADEENIFSIAWRRAGSGLTRLPT